MFDISFTELLVVGVIALVVIGPERLPKVARTIGHLVGRAQRYVSDVKTDIQREVELDELRKLKDQMQDAAQSVQSSLQNTESAIRQPLEAFEQSTMATLNELKSPLDTSTEAGTASTSTSALDARSSTGTDANTVTAQTPAQLELDALRPTDAITGIPAPVATNTETTSGSKS